MDVERSLGNDLGADRNKGYEEIITARYHTNDIHQRVRASAELRTGLCQSLLWHANRGCKLEGHSFLQK